MVDRLGWFSVIMLAFCLFNSPNAIPKTDDVVKVDPPTVIVPPKPDVILPIPEETPKPITVPKPDATTAVLARLETVLRNLSTASLELLTSKLEALDKSQLESIVKLLNKYGETGKEAVVETPTKTLGATTICPCRGNDKNGCLCLKAGVKCHCTRDVGSIWEKTKLKANVTTGKPITETSVPAKTAEPVSSERSYPVNINGQYMYWNVDGVQYHNSGMGIREGVLYGERFKYSDGKMYDMLPASQAPAVPVPQTYAQPASNTQSGYWTRVCHGGYCTMQWVSTN